MMHSTGQLPVGDQNQVRSAEGWLELGDYISAFAVADGLTRLLPDDPEVFVWRSHSARRMPSGSNEQALQLLLDAAKDFPDETAVPFELARYNCLLGKLTEARSWLRIAFEVAERNGTAKQWKIRALSESDLERFWEDIGSQ
jgi:tetratricopeptide (TPR) repeat protein